MSNKEVCRHCGKSAGQDLFDVLSELVISEAEGLDKKLSQEQVENAVGEILESDDTRLSYLITDAVQKVLYEK